VLSGAVKNGAMTIRGAQDSNVRTYTADGRASLSVHRDDAASYPALDPYLFWMCVNSGKGGVSPPAVSKPVRPNR
jgi:hypothetical protein